MADRITCCPHCSTSFRITDAQLQTARGAVRCGSCLQIFKALDNLLPTADSPSPTDDLPAAQPPSTPANDGHLNDASLSDEDWDDDALISDDMDREDGGAGLNLGDLSDDFRESGTFGRRKGSLFDRELPVREVENDHSDESWALSLLEEEEPETSGTGAQRDGAPDTPLDTRAEVGEYSEPLSDEFDYSTTDTGSFDAVPEESAEVTPAPDRHRRQPLFSVTDERDLHEDEDDSPLYPAPLLAEADSRVEPTLSDNTYSDPAFSEAEADSEQFRDEPYHGNALLQAIATAPLEMDWQPPPSHWPRRLLWGGLSLLAGLVLLLQLAWFNFDDWSRQQPWRPIYANVCPLLGCTLPPLADPARVKAYNLVVRSHPRLDNALIVDSILLNNAPFEQPFPDFTLSFTDLSGKQLAWRRFTPREYLAGELAGAALMPKGQPVHISLEIEDPGPEAVNYSARIPR